MARKKFMKSTSRYSSLVTRHSSLFGEFIDFFFIGWEGELVGEGREFIAVDAVVEGVFSQVEARRLVQEFFKQYSDLCGADAVFLNYAFGDFVFIFVQYSAVHAFEGFFEFRIGHRGVAAVGVVVAGCCGVGGGVGVAGGGSSCRCSAGYCSAGVDVRVGIGVRIGVRVYVGIDVGVVVRVRAVLEVDVHVEVVGVGTDVDVHIDVFACYAVGYAEVHIDVAVGVGIDVGIYVGVRIRVGVGVRIFRNADVHIDVGVVGVCVSVAGIGVGIDVDIDVFAGGIGVGRGRGVGGGVGRGRRGGRRSGSLLGFAVFYEELVGSCGVGAQGLEGIGVEGAFAFFVFDLVGNFVGFGLVYAVELYAFVDGVDGVIGKDDAGFHVRGGESDDFNVGLWFAVLLFAVENEVEFIAFAGEYDEVLHELRGQRAGGGAGEQASSGKEERKTHDVEKFKL